MKIINFDEIKKLEISPIKCYEWVNEMIINKENTILPAKAHLDKLGGVFCNVMPSCISVSGMSYFGVKVVTRYPERVPSLDSKIILINANSGEFLALMDGNWITAMRTGAVATHSIINFAKRNFNTIGIVGLGNTARATMLIMNSIISDRVLNIKLLKYKQQAENFVQRFSKCNNLKFTIVDDIKELVKGSDVVLSCATYFENDICENEYFNEGVLVVPVHTRGFTNCDLFFDKVYADDTEHVKNFKNFSKFKYFAEVADVVKGKAIGRENDKERILSYNIGISIHDINYAVHIYNILKENDVVFDGLKNIDMHEPKDKFWV